MKCPNCGEEVLLAARCPYCGHPTGAPQSASQGVAEQAREAVGGEHRDDAERPGQARGRFVGVWSHGPASRSGGDTAKERIGTGEWLRRFVRYIVDPSVAGWKKALIAGGLLYLVSPIDILPDVFPLSGWVDDLLVIWMGLRALTGELLRYGPGAR